MSDLSDTPEIPNKIYESNEAPSPWTMLVTMLLLIAGLLLASALMMNHLSKATAESGEMKFGFSELLEKAKALTAQVTPPQTEETVSTQSSPSSPLDSLKQIVSSDKVRWPRLKLTGFGTSADGLESFAIINGDQVHPGQMIGKVNVVEVRTHAVVVEYMGEQKLLTTDFQD